MTVKRDTQAEIRLLEERLANPGPEENARTLGLLIAEDFREIGSSGRMFDAQTVLGALGTVAQRAGRGTISLEEFRLDRVAPNVMLTTYVAKSAAGPGWRPPSLRSSLWCKRDGRWQVVFHQGTPVPAEKTP